MEYSVFCLKTFEEEFKRLMKKESYNDLEQVLIDFFFSDMSSVDKLRTGRKLNTFPGVDYIKHDLKGRGGFRCYYTLYISDNKVYLMYVHPKKGTQGSENTTKDARSEFFKELTIAKKNNDLLSMTVENESLVFKELDPEPLKKA